MLKPLQRILIFLLFASAVTAHAETIEKINIVGNHRISTSSIQFRIHSKEGKALDLPTIRDDVKRLWDLHVFADIQVDVTHGKTGEIVTYLVKERPIIKDYRFFGNHAFGPNLLKDKLKEKGIQLRQNIQLDYAELSKIKQAILDLYHEKGYRNVSVSHVLENAGRGIAYLTITIQEGGKAHVYGIKFVGNTVFSNKKLRKSMKKIKKHWMFSFLGGTDIYSEKKFSEAVDNIKKLYWKKGYKDIFVGQPIIKVKDFTSERQKRKNIKRAKARKKLKKDIRMFLTIPVYEGQAYKIGNVSFEGNKLLPDSILYSKWKLKKGSPFDVGKINEFQSDIEKLYNNSGYLQFYMERILNKEKDHIEDITFRIKENKRFKLHRLEFEGNVVTRDKVLRREFMIPEGSPFGLQTFKDSMLRINQLGFFDVSKSNPDVKFVPGKDQVDVKIKGEESGVNELNFGGGYSEFAGFFLQSSYTTRNFLGKGEQLTLQGSFGSRITYYNLSFTEPWLFDYPHSFTINLFNSETTYYNYSRKSTGFSIGFGFRLKTFLTYSVAYSFELVDVPGSSLQDNTIFKPVSNRLTSSITQSLNYSTLDNPFMPIKGSKYTLSFLWAGWQLGGDNLKYQINVRAAHLFKGYKSTIFLANVRASYQQALEGNTIPYYDRFFIGGESTVRGYDFRRISPVDPATNIAIGGTKMFVGNFEWIFPIEHKFQFAVFYDVGGVWLEDESFFSGANSLKRSWGFEARFNLPVFQMPIRLTYGIPLDTIPGQIKSGGNLEFTIGTIF
ncbi:MAG: outer membrane protein assembly factor BamA [Acidobacteria bacterium]|nr:outer membrane protein assembly factor BamA [Acidobacteriota bacterium]